MHYKSLMATALIAGPLLFIAAFFPPSVDGQEKEAVLMQTILTGLEQLHYAPVEIDDAFSKKVYDLYLDRLDGGRRWLMQRDVKELDQYQTKLDDEAQAGSYAFVNRATELVQEGLDRSQTLYREILAEPFDFSIKEDAQLDGEKRGWAKNEKELREYWRKSLKYETLTRLADMKDKQAENPDDEDLKGLSEAELEAKARKAVLKMYDDWYDRLAKRKRNDHLSTYLNSVTNVFDPHTSYYEPIDKENFDIGMSGKLEGIGARLQTDGEYTKVSSIVVGGPAWKQGELTEDDRITKVAQGIDGEWKDITGMTINEVVQLIRGEKGSIVRLSVKSAAGDTKEVIIERDVVITKEGFAKSLLIEGDQGNNIGYIRLPRFYADFNDRNGRRCAKDVATEVKKLKEAGVDGIVLDLRNNGGGSLRDVVKMSGLFIEEGPIVQVKSRDRKPEVLSDDNDDVLYAGPLIVMVNQYSASASEILAAALQDYDRALIVGSTNTFGKGTVQRFFDLDRAIPGNPAVKPLGEIKLTTQKFYRVDGGSTQLKGVTPDIILPNNYTYLKVGEQENEFPLEWTEISEVRHDQEVYRLGGTKARLQQSANQRIANSPVFQRIDENAKRWKAQRDESETTLNLQAYVTKQRAEDAESDAFDALFETEVVDGIRNLPVDAKRIAADEAEVERNKDWIEGLEKDVYLEEVLNIMTDMLQMQ